MTGPSECFANMIAGCVIAVGLAEDKGVPFAEMVIGSDRWSFPKVSIPEAEAFVAANTEHCRCATCHPPRIHSLKQPKQLSLF